MKVVNISGLEETQQNFEHALSSFSSTKLSQLSSSYVSSCSNAYVSQMKSKLSSQYQSILSEYKNINQWWKDYLKDIHSVERVLSQVNYGFADSSLSVFVQGKFQDFSISKTSLSGKFSLVRVDPSSYSFGSSDASTPSFEISNLLTQTLLCSQMEKAQLLEKYLKGEYLDASEVEKVSGYLANYYNESLKEAQEASETSEKQFQELNDFFESFAGTTFSLDTILEMKEEARKEANGLALQYKDQINFLDSSFFQNLGLTKEEFAKKDAEEIGTILLEKDPNIGKDYKRYETFLKDTEYQDLDTFIEKITEAQTQYYQDLNQKMQLESAVKSIPYVMMTQTQEYQNYKVPNKIDAKDIQEVTTMMDNPGGAVEYIVNYETYAKTHPDANPLNFVAAVNQYYGEDVIFRGIERADLLKELAVVQTEDSLQDMSKYYQFCYDTFGSEKALEYIEDYENEIHAFCGEVKAKEFLEQLQPLNEEERKNSITNQLQVTGKGLTKGIEGFVYNLGYLMEGLVKENRTTSYREYENAAIVKALSSEKAKTQMGLITTNQFGENISTSDIIDYTQNYGMFAEHNYQISQSIGNMLPSLAVSAVNPFAGSFALGASAAGGSYHSAMTEGYGRGESMLYGALSGASEVLLEKALGAMPLISETQVVSFKTMAQAMGKEFQEEFIQSYVDAGIGSFVLKKDFDFVSTTKDAIQSGIYGGITGGIMNIPSLAINSTSIRTIENQVRAGNVSKSDIVQSFHELIPETAHMNYDEIITEYSGAAKNLTLELVEANGKTVAKSGASTLLGLLVSDTKQNLLGDFRNLVQSLNIENSQSDLHHLETDLTQTRSHDFSNALKSSLDTITNKIQTYYSEDINGVVTKTSVQSIPKAVIGAAASIPNLILKGIYKPVTSSTEVSNTLVNDGIYHITDIESANKILESGYVKASNSAISLGTPKSFFFAGRPSFEDIAINLLSVDRVQTAVKIDVDSTELSSFNYRAYDDGAITYQGDLKFKNGQAKLVYLGLDIDENGKLYYKEISESEYYAIKNENIGANGISKVLSGVSNELKSIFVALSAQADIMKGNIKTLGDMFGPVRELEPAFAGVQSFSDVEDVITNHSDVNQLLGETAWSSLPKAAVSIATSFITRPFFFRYTPVTTSNSFSQKILNEGLYHFASEETVSKIQESGYIKASDYFTSYGNKKSFFFAGIPDIEDVAMNTSSLADKRVAVKINVDQSELQNFRYRDLVDNAVSYDGDYIFNSDQFSVVYLGLTEENGKVVYKEISKSEYDQYQSNVSESKKESLLKTVETFIIGIASDWTYTKNRLQKLVNAFKNTNIEETGALYTNGTSKLSEALQQFHLEDTIDLIKEGVPVQGLE